MGVLIMIILIIIVFFAIISSYKDKIKKTKEYKEHSLPVKIQISDEISEADCSPTQLTLTYEIDGEVIRGTLDSKFRYSKSQIRRLRSRKKETDVYVNTMNKKKFIIPDIYESDLLLIIAVVGNILVLTLAGYCLFRTWYFVEFELYDWLNEKINSFFTYR